jgi:hypothetical protein
MDIKASHKAYTIMIGVIACTLAVKIDKDPRKVKQKNIISA